MSGVASGAATKGAAWVNTFVNSFVRSVESFFKNVVYSGTPKVSPLVEASTTAVQYTPTALAYRYGALLIPPLITLCIITYSCLQFTGSNSVLLIFRNIRACFSGVSVRKLKDSKNQSRVYKIFWRIIHWPVYILIAVVRLFFSFFNMETLLFIIVCSLLTYIGLGIETNQNDVIQAADTSLAVGRGFYNFFGGLANALWEIIYGFFAPIYNPIVEFLYTIGAITYKYIQPVLQGKRVGTFTGRQLEDASLPFVGKGFKTAMRVIGTFIEVIHTIFLKFLAYMYDIILYLIFGVASNIIYAMIQLVQGFHCYIDLRYIECTIRQLVQMQIATLATVLNVFINIVLSIGIRDIPGVSVSLNPVPLNFIDLQCDSPPAGTTPKECNDCKSAFPGWICKKPPTTRLLIACDELPNEHWQEIVYWEGDVLEVTSTPKNTSIEYERCPLTHKLIEENEHTIYHKYLNDYTYRECITIQKNMETINRCPSDNPSGDPARRQLNLVNEVVGERKKIKRGVFTTQYRKLLDSQSDSSHVFDCSEHENTTHLFDIMCGMQTLSTREALFPSLKEKATKASANFYRHQHTHHQRRLQEGFPSLQYEGDMLLNKWMHALYEYEHFEEIEEGRRRLQPALINQTSPNSCLPGYSVCYGTQYCELIGSCACPVPTREFHTLMEEVLYNLHVSSCDSSDLVVTLVQSIGDCWANYKKDDTISPFVKSFDVAADAINGKQKVYCFPLLGPDSFRIQKWESWSLQTYLVDTYCNETTTGVPNTISDCVCPGYDSGVYAYDADWKQWGYYLWARLVNFGKFVQVWFFALLNSGGYWNYVWSGFWGSFGVFPPGWVTAFDVTLSWHEMKCGFFHIGSVCAIAMLIVICSKFMYNCFPSVFTIMNDSFYSLLMISPFYKLEDRFLEREKRVNDNFEKIREGKIPTAQEVKAVSPEEEEDPIGDLENGAGAGAGAGRGKTD